MKSLKLPCATEAQEGKLLKSWADYHPICKNHLIHIANESKTSWQNGKSLKDQGKKKGVSDYFLAYPAGGKSGLWIELKRSNKSLSRLSAEQAEWLATCERVGYSTSVAYGADEAIQKINEYLSVKCCK
jgi:hypothetical protein